MKSWGAALVFRAWCGVLMPRQGRVTAHGQETPLCVKQKGEEQHSSDTRKVQRVVRGTVPEYASEASLHLGLLFSLENCKVSALRSLAPKLTRTCRLKIP